MPALRRMGDFAWPHTRGAPVAERLARSPPTKANRVQSSAGSLMDFRMWESCRTMPFVGGFSRGSPVSPPFHSGAAPYSPQSPSSALKTSQLRDAQTSSSSGILHGNTILSKKKPAYRHGDFIDFPVDSPQQISQSLSCVFIGCCPAPGSYGIRKVFPGKSAIGSEACKAGLINCDPISKKLLTLSPVHRGRCSNSQQGHVCTLATMTPSDKGTSHLPFSSPRSFPDAQLFEILHLVAFTTLHGSDKHSLTSQRQVKLAWRGIGQTNTRGGNEQTTKVPNTTVKILYDNPVRLMLDLQCHDEVVPTVRDDVTARPFPPPKLVQRLQYPRQFPSDKCCVAFGKILERPIWWRTSVNRKPNAPLYRSGARAHVLAYTPVVATRNQDGVQFRQNTTGALVIGYPDGVTSQVCLTAANTVLVLRYQLVPTDQGANKYKMFAIEFRSPYSRFARARDGPARATDSTSHELLNAETRDEVQLIRQDTIDCKPFTQSETFDWSIISSATTVADDQPMINVVEHSKNAQCCVDHPLASHQGKPGSLPGLVTRFPHVGIGPDDDVGGRVFSGISRFPRPLIPTVIHTHLNHSHRLSRLRCKLVLAHYCTFSVHAAGASNHRAAIFRPLTSEQQGTHYTRPVASAGELLSRGGSLTLQQFTTCHCSLSTRRFRSKSVQEPRIYWPESPARTDITQLRGGQCDTRRRGHAFHFIVRVGGETRDSPRKAFPPSLRGLLTALRLARCYCSFAFNLLKEHPYTELANVLNVNTALNANSKAERASEGWFHALMNRRIFRGTKLLPPNQGDPDFYMWESCRTMPSVGGFSRGSPVSPAPSSRCCSILTSTTHIGSQDLEVKSRPNFFTQFTKLVINF
ncbi:hypothetical protein PR048_026327 [Dryococelus australis]|uniref:Uncharacterized protein n=1 Tax=Dryococelus australis TaxID=614101 RepID=A0ABQ9GL11_9NEOP|nr:hypothetical protein PR048_026327 [Dryococelus australis]